MSSKDQLAAKPRIPPAPVSTTVVRIRPLPTVPVPIPSQFLIISVNLPSITSDFAQILANFVSFGRDVRPARAVSQVTPQIGSVARELTQVFAQFPAVIED